MAAEESSETGLTDDQRGTQTVAAVVEACASISIHERLSARASLDVGALGGPGGPRGALGAQLIERN